MIRIVLFSLNTYIHNAFEKRFIRGNDISSKLVKEKKNGGKQGY